MMKNLITTFGITLAILNLCLPSFAQEFESISEDAVVTDENPESPGGDLIINKDIQDLDQVGVGPIEPEETVEDDFFAEDNMNEESVDSGPAQEDVAQDVSDELDGEESFESMDEMESPVAEQSPVTEPIDKSTAEPESGFFKSLVTVEEPVLKSATPVDETIVIEPQQAVRTDKARRKVFLLPYSERRNKWGTFVGLSAGLSYEPTNYQPDLLASDFEETYSDSEQPLFELHLNIKRNFSKFSLGYELGIATYSNQAQEDVGDGSMELTILKFGAQLAVDNIFAKNPYVVPYISGGIYTAYITERLASVSFNGNTQAAFYATGGLMFDIGWLDPVNARQAYHEAGIENTFLFAEATQYMASANEADGDLSATSVNAGLKIEF